MRSKETARTVWRASAAALLVAGWAASVGIAAADPDPAPAPSNPAPAPSGSPAPAPAGTPKTTIDHDGVYTVGTDIAPGTYSSGGPVGSGTCYWKRIGNPDGALIDNAMTKKPQVVQIEPTDKAFKTSGCQPWQPSSDAPSSGLPGPVAGAQLQTSLGILNGLLAPNGQRVP
ncbi:hypothetical protein [Mycobacterium asiaticum]|uniref:Lipoprotein n=1 Tax=Mycobacterium asiaticum TaxID=1790 RepID=A0A1A3N4S1_MYCAS|nr:hypothetical protein [Mycobacterium asiaticum]OBK16064.1 hypothetical protein A5636_04460 [Mycobacterium asiaticum]